MSSQPQQQPMQRGSRQNNKQQKNRDSQQHDDNNTSSKRREGRDSRDKRSKPRGASKKQQQNSRTVLIGRFFVDDLDQPNENIANHLKSTRSQALRELLTSFGELERYELDGNKVFAMFKDRAAAVTAVETLKREDKQREFSDALKAKLSKAKISEQCAPQLTKYRYQLTERNPDKGPFKNAYKQQAPQQSTPKNVVAQQQVPSTTTTTSAPSEQTQQNADSKKKKKNGGKNLVVSPVVEQVQQQVNNEEVRRAATEELRKETEIARLKDEQQFFTRQQLAVQSELKNELERVKDRDMRITSLSRDLERVQLEKQRLETQLSAEQQWKKKGEESIAKLEDELNHLQEQSQSAAHRLSVILSSSVPQTTASPTTLVSSSTPPPSKLSKQIGIPHSNGF